MTAKDSAVQQLLTWIRAKAQTAGINNTVKWGNLKFKVASATEPFGVYSLYPITAAFPKDVYAASAPVSTTGDTTAASATVAIADTTGITQGMIAEGPGIPFGTTVSTVTTNVSVVLSAPVSTSGTGVTLVFYTNINGDGIQENVYLHTFDHGTKMDIAVIQGGKILYSIYVIDQDRLQEDILRTTSKELSRIMTKKILYAKVKDILKYPLANPPLKFPGQIF